jgi:hypothetical protein
VVAVESPWAWTAAGMATAAASIAAQALARTVERPARAAVAAKETAAQADLVREVFGNPWRPPASAPGTSPQVCADALDIARRAYEEGNFRALPVLADALEDAGCTDTELLTHLRSPGPHVRGCWAECERAPRRRASCRHESPARGRRSLLPPRGRGDGRTHFMSAASRGASSDSTSSLPAVVPRWAA